ncbi:MAG: type II toxin-antitoxin system RelE/ParE family toxin [Bacteroidales bacterium]|nr:type II toxin-antitoxin system RelE/ParE family toxin [Bacteroidales bacterium]
MVFGEWFEKIKNTKGIYEFRIQDSNKFYRLFAFWDRTQEKETLIVCSHGLTKKTNKTPKKEIKKAEMIKEKYFDGLI